jgi:hypothetical protein
MSSYRVFTSESLTKGGLLQKSGVCMTVSTVQLNADMSLI